MKSLLHGGVVTIGVVLAIAALVSCGAYYWGYERAAIVLDRAQQQAHDSKETAEQAAMAIAQGNVEAELDRFLKELRNRMHAYRKKRRILSDLVLPDNLRRATYIEENYILAQVMVPEMRVEIDAVLQEFDKADARMIGYVADISAADKLEILLHWHDKRAGQFMAYTAYFSLERALLDAHLQLLEVYYQGRHSIVHDGGGAVLAIGDEKLQREIHAIRSTIKALGAVQKKALSH